MEAFEKKKEVDVNIHLFRQVWKHWKPSFAKSKWSLAATTLFFSCSMALEILLKPIWWRDVFDALIEHHPYEGYFMLALAVSLVAFVCSRIADTCIAFAESKIIRDLKDYILMGLLGKNMQFYSDHSSGGLVAKSKRFASVSEQVIDEMVLSVIRSTILVLYLLVFTCFIIPKLTPVFLVWVVLFVAMVTVLSRHRRKHDLASSNADSLTIGLLSDTLLSIFTLRIFSASQRQFEKFAGVTQDEAGKRRYAWLLGNVQWGLQSIMVIALEFTCMHFVLRDIEKGVYKVGTAALVQSYIASLSMYMWGLGRSIVKVRSAFAEAHEMSELLDMPNEEPIVRTADVELSHYGISIHDLSFKYDDGGSVLRDFRYDFEDGKSYGIIGETGSGKSTLMKLVMRFYNPDTGRIILGGVDISDIDKNRLRELIAFVPQNPVFPSITIREVITLGKPDATQGEIEDVARRASCGFIWEKNLGFDTLIGERGVKLSGGEAQRLAIAAAILKDAPIVIMDEPTSALDAETEHSIQQALQTHFRGKTMIVIAHRLATVAILDEIILLEKGKIPDNGNGSHDELLLSSEAYRHMWSLQTNPRILVHE